MKEMKAHIDPILVFVHCELSLLFCHFINATAYQLVSYKPSSPSAKELHDGGRMYWRQIVEVKIIRKGVQQQRITSCQSQYE